MRRIVYIILAVFVLIGIGMGIWAYRFIKPSSERVLKFVSENPDNFSIHFIYNGEVLVSHNDRSDFDLATVPDLLTLIELSEQLADSSISRFHKIRFEELKRYQIPGTDGASFLVWKESSYDKDIPQFVGIDELASGVSRFGSAAHSSYLMELLSLEKINRRTKLLGLKEQEPIFYYPSSMFMWQKADSKDEKEHLSYLENLPDEQYFKYSEEFHFALKSDSTRRFAESLGRLGYDQLKVWSNRLPKGSSKEYANLMWRIMLGSSDSIALTQVNYLQNLLQWPMTIGANKDFLKTAGMKGGSTPFVLSKAFYAWDLEDNKSAICYSFRGMTPVQTVRLQLSMNEFEIDLLKDRDFVSRLSALLPARD